MTDAKIYSLKIKPVIAYKIPGTNKNWKVYIKTILKTKITFTELVVRVDDGTMFRLLTQEKRVFKTRELSRRQGGRQRIRGVSNFGCF